MELKLYQLVKSFQCDHLVVLPPIYWLERSPYIAQAQASKGFLRFSIRNERHFFHSFFDTIIRENGISIPSDSISFIPFQTQYNVFKVKKIQYIDFFS